MKWKSTSIFETQAHLQLSVLRPWSIRKQLKSNQGNERDRNIA